MSYDFEWRHPIVVLRAHTSSAVKEQISDLFTKPLDKTTFLYLRSLLMSEQH